MCYDNDVVPRNEYDQVMYENQRLRDAVQKAKDLARKAWHNQSIEDFQYDVAEIERILSGV